MEESCEPFAMTYPGNRQINDADSHLMELPDFLTSRADPGYRDEIAGRVQGALRALLEAGPQNGRKPSLLA